AVGVAGSLRRGDIRLGSDIDLTTIVNAVENYYCFKRKEVKGIYVEITYISLDVVEKILEWDFSDYPTVIYYICLCKALYDPKNILEDLIEKTNRIWMSPKYYRQEIIPHIDECFTRANKSLQQSRNALKNKDYASSILYSRDSCLKGLHSYCGVGNALILASKAPQKGAGRTASLCKLLFKHINEEHISKRLFSVLDLDKIDTKTARKYMTTLKNLLQGSKLWFNRPEIQNKLKNWLSYMQLAFDDREINVYYKGGYFLDLIWSARFNANMLKFLILVINGIKSENAFFIHEISDLAESPKNFLDLYLKCIDAYNINYNQAKNKVDKATEVVKDVKDIVNEISGLRSKYVAGEMVLNDYKKSNDASIR
ncbi:MAG: hypothetical protein ACXABK_06845, partial [Candidatus Heimdallarchaeaceae archaeon]